MNVKDSPLVQLAGEAKRPTPWWLGWIIVFGVGVIGAQVLFSGVQPALGFQPGSIPAQLMELVVNAATIAVLALWVVLKERRRFASIGLTRPRSGLPRFGVGLAVGVGMFLVPTGLLMVTGQYHVVDAGARLSGWAALPAVLGLLVVWVVQGSTEEMVMRGYLLQIHGRQLNSWLAVGIVSVGFAVAHLGASPIALLNITLVALLFSFVSLRQGSIWMACGIHVGWNFTQGNLLGIPVSGNPYQTSLVFLGPTPGSSDLLTGGQFGIEQSLAATVLLAVLATWSCVAYVRHSTHKDPASEPLETSEA